MLCFAWVIFRGIAVRGYGIPAMASWEQRRRGHGLVFFGWSYYWYECVRNVSSMSDRPSPLLSLTRCEAIDQAVDVKTPAFDQAVAPRRASCYRKRRGSIAQIPLYQPQTREY